MLKSVLLSLSGSRRLQRFMESNRLGRTLSRRFVAGTALGEAVEAVADLHRDGLLASLDLLGENTRTLPQAEAAAQAALSILDAIAQRGLRCGISIKLTQFGLDLGEEIALGHLRRVLERAQQVQRFVRVDMEGSAYTEATLRIVEQAHRENFPVGTVLQAYLFRSMDDLQRMVAQGISLRLVKGAYKEPASIAWQQKSEVDAHYVRMMQALLSSGQYHAIATHDERMIEATLACAHQLGLAPGRFEFQMLYGIRRDLQTKLRDQGWPVRVYVPFGSEWYPYFMRRLAERPANLLFLLKNLAR